MNHSEFLRACGQNALPQPSTSSGVFGGIGGQFAGDRGLPADATGWLQRPDAEGVFRAERALLSWPGQERSLSCWLLQVLCRQKIWRRYDEDVYWAGPSHGQIECQLLAGAPAAFDEFWSIFWREEGSAAGTTPLFLFLPELEAGYSLQEVRLLMPDHPWLVESIALHKNVRGSFERMALVDFPGEADEPT